MRVNRANRIGAEGPGGPGSCRPRRSAFAASAVIHGLAALGLLMLPGRAPIPVEEREPIEIVFYAPEKIEAPEPIVEPANPEPEPVPAAQLDPTPRPETARPPAQPRRLAPEPSVRIAEVSAPVAVAAVVAIPDPVEPAPTARPVETRALAVGGFGARGRVTLPRRERALPAAAGFDLTAGQQQTTKPSRGEITVSGFDLAGSVEPQLPGRSRSLIDGAFGSVTAIVAPGPSRRRAEAEPDKPVAILSKPKPVYTADARDRRIEGEVVLEVTFVVSGALHVQRVVKGLGHGLDQAAIDAAQGIRFEPARKGGRPIDYTATVSVIFRLA